MAHRYGHPISVTLVTGQPQSFLWRGRHYRVAEVFSIWRLRDRWWERPTSSQAAVPALSAGDRTYYRVRCPDPDGEQIFDLYHDAVTGRWVLDRAHD